MALKENYVLWDEAVCLSSRGEHENGLRKFKQVLDPSSKILFNIGCLQMLLGRNEEAVMSFSQTVDKDQHLAVGYFQRGVGNLKCSRYQHAVQDFRSACDKLRDNKHIDYKQLGLKYKLYQSEILHNMALAYANLKNFDKASSLLQVVLSSCSSDDINHDFIDKAIEKVKRKEIPDFAVCLPKDALFKPSKSVISNLQKKDYLGKAKVISSLEHDDTFSGFIGAKKQTSQNISTSLPGSPIGGRKKHGPPSKEVVDFLEKQIQVGPPKKPPPPNYAPPQLPVQKVIPGTAIQRSRFQRGVAGTASSPPKLRVKKGRNVANDISHKPVTINPSLPNTFEDLNVKISPPKPPRTFEHTVSRNLMETVGRKSEILPPPVPESIPGSPNYLELVPSSPENENSEYFDMNCGPRKCTYDNAGAPDSKPLLNNNKQTNGRKPPPKQILPPRPSKFDKNEDSDRHTSSYPENPATSVRDVQRKSEASKLELAQRKENDKITGNEQSKKLSKKPPPPRKTLPARPPPVTQKGGSILDDDHEYIYPGMYTACSIISEGEKESFECGESEESGRHDNKNKNPQVPTKPNHITRKKSIIVTFVNEENSRTTPVSFGLSFADMQQKVCDLLSLKKEKISLWCCLHHSPEHKLIKCETSMQQVWDSMSANRSETLKIWAKPKESVSQG